MPSPPENATKARQSHPESPDSRAQNPVEARKANARNRSRRAFPAPGRWSQISSREGALLAAESTAAPAAASRPKPRRAWKTKISMYRLESPFPASLVEEMDNHVGQE